MYYSCLVIIYLCLLFWWALLVVTSSSGQLLIQKYVLTASYIYTYIYRSWRLNTGKKHGKLQHK